MGYLGEFDSLDEELFSEPLDYAGGRPGERVVGPASERVQSQPSERAGAGPLVFPEPTTVRLEQRAPILATPHPSPAGLFSDDPYDRFRESRYREDPEERDPVLAIAFIGLLVLVLIATGMVMWWFA